MNRVRLWLPHVAALVSLVIFTPYSSAQTYTWNLSGSGDWDTTTPNWVGAGTTWVNSNTSQAVISALTPTTITLTENITANTITTAGGSSLILETNNNSTLTLAGTGAGFLVGASSNVNVEITGSVGLTKSGNGGLTINTAATYTGATIISAGSIAVTTNNALPTATDLTVASGALFSLVIGASQQVAGLAGAGTVQTLAGTSTLTLSGTSGGTDFTGVLQNSSGTLSVTKTGSGTQTLSGTNTYTGATTIEGGALEVNGTLGNTAIAVNGGTLTGSGSVSGAVTFTSGGGLGADLAGAFDQTDIDSTSTHVVIGSTLTLADGTVFRLFGDENLTQGQSYSVVLANTASYGGDPTSFSVVSGSGTFSAFTGTSLSYDGGSNNLTLTFTPVPEPATVFGLGTLALGVFGGVRRRVVRKA